MEGLSGGASCGDLESKSFSSRVCAENSHDTGKLIAEKALPREESRSALVEDERRSQSRRKESRQSSDLNALFSEEEDEVLFRQMADCAFLSVEMAPPSIERDSPLLSPRLQAVHAGDTLLPKTSTLSAVPLTQAASSPLDRRVVGKSHWPIAPHPAVEDAIPKCAIFSLCEDEESDEGSAQGGSSTEFTPAWLKQSRSLSGFEERRRRRAACASEVIAMFEDATSSDCHHPSFKDENLSTQTKLRFQMPPEEKGRRSRLKRLFLGSKPRPSRLVSLHSRELARRAMRRACLRAKSLGVRAARETRRFLEDLRDHPFTLAARDMAEDFARSLSEKASDLAAAASLPKTKALLERIREGGLSSSRRLASCTGGAGHLVSADSARRFVRRGSQETRAAFRRTRLFAEKAVETTARNAFLVRHSRLSRSVVKNLRRVEHGLLREATRRGLLTKDAYRKRACSAVRSVQRMALGSREVLRRVRRHPSTVSVEKKLKALAERAVDSARRRGLLERKTYGDAVRLVLATAKSSAANSFKTVFVFVISAAAAGSKTCRRGGVAALRLVVEEGAKKGVLTKVPWTCAVRRAATLSRKGGLFVLDLSRRCAFSASMASLHSARRLLFQSRRVRSRGVSFDRPDPKQLRLVEARACKVSELKGLAPEFRRQGRRPSCSLPPSAHFLLQEKEDSRQATLPRCVSDDEGKAQQQPQPVLPLDCRLLSREVGNPQRFVFSAMACHARTSSSHSTEVVRAGVQKSVETARRSRERLQPLQKTSGEFEELLRRWQSKETTAAERRRKQMQRARDQSASFDKHLLEMEKADEARRQSAALELEDEKEKKPEGIDGLQEAKVEQAASALVEALPETLPLSRAESHSRVSTEETAERRETFSEETQTALAAASKDEVFGEGFQIQERQFSNGGTNASLSRLPLQKALNEREAEETEAFTDLEKQGSEAKDWSSEAGGDNALSELEREIAREESLCSYPNFSAPTKWEVFAFFQSALCAYALIYLCTRGVSRSILLIFCCLFGFRVRVGGSDSRSGGSYTSMWLLFLQLTVVAAFCGVSIAKQRANPEALQQQLEESSLYTADIRITSTLLFVVLLYAAYVGAFLLLGHLGFAKFFSFVCQPLDLTVFSMEDARGVTTAMQFAAASFCLLLGGARREAGILLASEVFVCVGRVLASKAARKKANREEARGEKGSGSAALFFVGMALQVVFSVLALLTSATALHGETKASTDALSRRAAHGQFGLSCFAAAVDLLLLALQLLSRVLCRRQGAGAKAEAFSRLLGGKFEAETAELVLRGRLHLRRDTEADVVESKYEYFLSVERSPASSFWLRPLFSLKCPIPKEVKKYLELQSAFNRLPRTVQRAATLPPGAGAKDFSPAFDSRTPLVLSVHSQELAREATAAVDTRLLRQLQTLALFSLGSLNEERLARPVVEEEGRHCRALSSAVFRRQGLSHLSAVTREWSEEGGLKQQPPFSPECLPEEKELETLSRDPPLLVENSKCDEGFPQLQMDLRKTKVDAPEGGLADAKAQSCPSTPRVKIRRSLVEKRKKKKRARGRSVPAGKEAVAAESALQEEALESSVPQSEGPENGAQKTPAPPDSLNFKRDAPGDSDSEKGNLQKGEGECAATSISLPSTPSSASEQRKKTCDAQQCLGEKQEAEGKVETSSNSQPPTDLTEAASSVLQSSQKVKHSETLSLPGKSKSSASSRSSSSKAASKTHPQLAENAGEGVQARPEASPSTEEEKEEEKRAEDKVTGEEVTGEKDGKGDCSKEKHGEEKVTEEKGGEGKRSEEKVTEEPVTEEKLSDEKVTEEKVSEEKGKDDDSSGDPQTDGREESLAKGKEEASATESQRPQVLQEEEKDISSLDSPSEALSESSPASAKETKTESQTTSLAASGVERSEEKASSSGKETSPPDPPAGRESAGDERNPVEENPPAVRTPQPPPACFSPQRLETISEEEVDRIAASLFEKRCRQDAPSPPQRRAEQLGSLGVALSEGEKLLSSCVEIPTALRDAALDGGEGLSPGDDAEAIFEVFLTTQKQQALEKATGERQERRVTATDEVHHSRGLPSRLSSVLAEEDKFNDFFRCLSGKKTAPDSALLGGRISKPPRNSQGTERLASFQSSVFPESIFPCDDLPVAHPRLGRESSKGNEFCSSRGVAREDSRLFSDLSRESAAPFVFSSAPPLPASLGGGRAPSLRFEQVERRASECAALGRRRFSVVEGISSPSGEDAVSREPLKVSSRRSSLPSSTVPPRAFIGEKKRLSELPTDVHQPPGVQTSRRLSSQTGKHSFVRTSQAPFSAETAVDMSQQRQPPVYVGRSLESSKAKRFPSLQKTGLGEALSRTERLSISMPEGGWMSATNFDRRREEAAVSGRESFAVEGPSLLAEQNRRRRSMDRSSLRRRDNAEVRLSSLERQNARPRGMSGRPRGENLSGKLTRLSAEAPRDSFEEQAGELASKLVGNSSSVRVSDSPLKLRGEKPPPVSDAASPSRLSRRASSMEKRRAANEAQQQQQQPALGRKESGEWIPLRRGSLSQEKRVVATRPREDRLSKTHGSLWESGEFLYSPEAMKQSFALSNPVDVSLVLPLSGNNNSPKTASPSAPDSPRSSSSMTSVSHISSRCSSDRPILQEGLDGSRLSRGPSSASRRHVEPQSLPSAALSSAAVERRPRTEPVGVKQKRHAFGTESLRGGGEEGLRSVAGGDSEAVFGSPSFEASGEEASPSQGLAIHRVPSRGLALSGSRVDLASFRDRPHTQQQRLAQRAPQQPLPSSLLGGGTFAEEGGSFGSLGREGSSAGASEDTAASGERERSFVGEIDVSTESPIPEIFYDSPVESPPPKVNPLPSGSGPLSLSHRIKKGQEQPARRRASQETSLRLCSAPVDIDAQKEGVRPVTPPSEESSGSIFDFPSEAAQEANDSWDRNAADAAQSREEGARVAALAKAMLASAEALPKSTTRRTSPPASIPGLDAAIDAFQNLKESEAEEIVPEAKSKGLNGSASFKREGREARRRDREGRPEDPEERTSKTHHRRRPSESERRRRSASRGSSTLPLERRRVGQGGGHSRRGSPSRGYGAFSAVPGEDSLLKRDVTSTREGQGQGFRRRSEEGAALSRVSSQAGDAQAAGAVGLSLGARSSQRFGSAVSSRPRRELEEVEASSRPFGEARRRPSLPEDFPQSFERRAPRLSFTGVPGKARDLMFRLGSKLRDAVHSRESFRSVDFSQQQSSNSGGFLPSFGGGPSLPAGFEARRRSSVEEDAAGVGGGVATTRRRASLQQFPQQTETRPSLVFDKSSAAPELSALQLAKERRRRNDELRAKALEGVPFAHAAF